MTSTELRARRIGRSADRASVITELQAQADEAREEIVLQLEERLGAIRRRYDKAARELVALLEQQIGRARGDLDEHYYPIEGEQDATD